MILVYGTVCLDRVRTVEKFPVPGQYVEVLSDEIRLGGEAANTAFALQTWGADYKLIGNHFGDQKGDLDENSKTLKRLLIDANLATEKTPFRNAPVPICDIYLTPNGERTMFGLGFKQIGDGLEFRQEWLEGVDWFTIDMNLGDFGLHALQRAAASGSKIYSMDFAFNNPELKPGSYFQSSTRWFGTRGYLSTVKEEQQERTRQSGITTIITDGDCGALLTVGGVSKTLPGFPIPGVIVDTTGAGDTFRAGMLYGLDQGWPEERCLHFARVAAALKCQWPGATTRQATLEEINRYL